MKLKCPHCRSDIRINVKHYPRRGKGRQAACTNPECGAKGPLMTTNEEAKAAFGKDASGN